jgi:exonuclease SbcC
MFKSLFKPKWQSAKADVRIASISTFSTENPEQLRILEQMARNDAVPAVRIAALQRLKNIETLISLVQSERDGDTQQKAQSHLLSLLVDGSATDAGMSKALATLNSETLLHLLERARNQALGERILASITDESVLASLAVKLPLAALRQAAAQRVEQPGLLEELAKAARGKDKSVYRIAKDKLDAIHSEQQAEATTEQKINELCSAFEAHARLSMDPQYVAKFEYLQKQWQRLQAQASADQFQRYQRATALCRAHIEENAAEASKLEEEARKQREAIEERVAACEQLEEAFKQLSFNAVLGSDDAPALSALLKTQKNRWDEAATVVPPQAEERKRFQTVYGQLDNLLGAAKILQKKSEAIKQASSALLESEVLKLHELIAMKKTLDECADGIRWPAEVRLPEVLELRDKALAHFHALHEVLSKAEQQAFDRVEQGIKALLKEIEHGNLKAANNALRDCQHQLKMLPMNKAQPFQRQLRDLMVKVNELRDWQGFATLPKKEALCENMEALVGADIDPQALANKVKRLQDEWRMLGTADAERSQKLWERFSAAADKAYESCRAYFDKLTQVRETNLAARETICQQLDDYLHKTDWEKIDWRAAREIFELAKQEWRNYSPVERKAGKDIQTRFNGLLQELQDRLDREFEKNALARRALIAEAESLLNANDLHSAIEKAKQLQRQWKDTGMVNPREDGKMWKQFRAACDNLFSRRDQQRADVQAERERHVSEAEAICDQIEKLADSVAFDSVAANEQFQQLQEQFEQIGALPKEQQEQIRKRYRAVSDHFRQGLGHAQIRHRSRRFDSLWQVAEWLDDQEAHVLAGEVVNIATALPGTDPLPDHAEPLALQRLKALQQFDAAATSDQQLADNAGKLRELCVRLEIATGVDSPVDDKEYRMQFQIARFNKGAAQRDARLSPGEMLEQLQVEWLGVGMVSSAERQRYSERFRRALQLANA